MDNSVNIPSTTTSAAGGSAGVATTISTAFEDSLNDIKASTIKTSPVPNEEIADEVKVFRSNPDVNDDDPTEIAGTQHQVNPIYNNPPHLDWPNALNNWLQLAHVLSPVYAANQRIAAMAQAAAQAAYVANVASAAQYIARHSPNFANLGSQFGAASFERPPTFSMGGQTPNNNSNRNGYSIQQHMASPMSSLGGVLGGISLSADRGENNSVSSRKHNLEQQQRHHQQHSNNGRFSINTPLKVPKREKHEHKIKEKIYHNSGKSSTTNSDGKHEHIKKPMNAFMLFMKENRHKYMDECADKRKQSAELNKELGQVWQRMTRDEQQPYYDMAQIKREEHQRLYPNWTARENYAIHKKAKKRRTRERSLENNDSKKCRARFGVDNQIKWCKHCKRKKKCLNVLRDADSPAQVSSTTNPTTPLSLGSISQLHQHHQQQQGGGQGSSSNNNLNGHQSTNSQFSNLFGLNLPQQHPPIKQQQLDSPLSSQKGQSTNSELSRCSSTASSDGGDESIEEEEESDMDEDNKADIKQNLMEGLESPIMSKQHDGRGAGVNVKTLKMETTPTSDSKLLFSPHTPPSHLRRKHHQQQHNQQPLLVDTPSKPSSLFGSSNNDVNNLLVAAAAASTLLPQHHSSPFSSSPSSNINPILQQQNIPSAFQMPPPTTPTNGAGSFPFQPTSPFFPWSGLNFMSSFMKH
uniref:HMG box domain-containing protein n=1 Tax=Meloidogyne floridensis TaxID=298350 RepID=A0A915P3E5_9BILA